MNRWPTIPVAPRIPIFCRIAAFFRDTAGPPARKLRLPGRCVDSVNGAGPDAIAAAEFRLRSGYRPAPLDRVDSEDPMRPGLAFLKCAALQG